MASTTEPGTLTEGMLRGTGGSAVRLRLLPGAALVDGVVQGVAADARVVGPVVVAAGAGVQGVLEVLLLVEAADEGVQGLLEMRLAWGPGRRGAVHEGARSVTKSITATATTKTGAVTNVTTNTTMMMSARNSDTTTNGMMM